MDAFIASRLRQVLSHTPSLPLHTLSNSTSLSLYIYIYIYICLSLSQTPARLRQAPAGDKMSDDESSDADPPNLHDDNVDSDQ